MSKRYPGGLITKTPVVPSGPYQCSTASGVWTLEQAMQYNKQGIWPTAGNVGPGSQSYTTPGTYSWVVPAGVTSVSVVAIGGGGGGGTGASAQGGGSGGGLGYKNNYSVTPGASITVVVGTGGPTGSCGGQSYFVNTSIASGAGGTTYAVASSGGSHLGTGGGCGGRVYPLSGGGGAAGYSGLGGAGGYASSTNGVSGAGGGGGGGGSTILNDTLCSTIYYSWYSGRAGGGGVGLFGQGSNGSGGTTSYSATKGGGGSGGANGNCGPGSGPASAAPGGTGGAYGGGGGAGGSQKYYSYPCYILLNCSVNNGGVGGSGAVRIVWPGSTRTFPSTCVGSP